MTEAEHNADSNVVKKILSRFSGLLQLLAILVFISVAFIYSRAPSEAQVLEDAVILDDSVLDIRPRVRTVNPRANKVTLTVETTGTLTVRSQVALVAQVGGQAVWVSPNLRAGGYFSANEILLRLDDRDYQLALSQANGDLAAQKANLLLAEAQSQAAKENWALLNKNQEIPPLVAKIPQIRQAEAAIQSAEARVELAKLNLSRTAFSLPFDGRIVSTTATEGQMIANNQPFGQAYALTSIEASVPISTVELSLIDPAIGRKVLAQTATQTLQGIVERVSSELDQRTREARLFVRFEEPTTISPGSFLNVIITGPEYSNAYVLPELTEQTNQSFWIVKDGVLQLVKIDIIARIAEGLVVPAFDTADGVVLGNVPGARIGMSVAVARDES